MCLPAAAVGIISGISSAASSVGGFIDAQNQASAANQSAINNYKYQVAERENRWNQELTIWNQRRVEYKQKSEENKSAAYRAYAQEQNRLNEVYKGAAFNNQAALIQMVNQSGSAQAKNVSGKSAQRLSDMAVAQFGRNQAIQAESIVSARNAYALNTDDLRNEWISANNKAYSDVAVRPVAGVAPPRPVMQSGPSGLGLIAGLGGAVVSGMSTYNSLKAPPATVPTPPPVPPAAPPPPPAAPPAAPPPAQTARVNFNSYSPFA